MKVSTTGEDLYFATQFHDVDPTQALANHLQVNTPASSDALFTWRHRNGLRPLTRSKFLRSLDRSSQSLKIELLKGHGIRNGGTLEYLLRGVPFETVKAMGRWSGEAFAGYLCKHAIVMAPYLQDTPVLEPFT
ncbi:hypothetical protein BDR03DRAFT_1012966 [Suillus americanus]|nr:hypothetical protein BDR03DRAFT_1012966 [Suillus americanus]